MRPSFEFNKRADKLTYHYKVMAYYFVKWNYEYSALKLFHRVAILLKILKKYEGMDILLNSLYRTEMLLYKNFLNIVDELNNKPPTL